MREEFAVSVGSESSAPWDRFIAASTFGAGGPSEGWWHLHLVLPLTVHVPLEHEGLPGGASGAASSSQGSRPPAKRVGNHDRPRGREPPAKFQKAAVDVSKDICALFNLQTGPCASGGPCRHGRRHVCSVCSELHAAVTEHPDFKDPRKGGAKAKGKGKVKDAKK